MKKQIFFLSVSLVLGLICFELALQAFSFLYAKHRLHHNHSLAANSKTTTIVCLGESTTQHAYPKFLQQQLNELFPEKNITVIDEGQAGANSDQLMRKLPRILKYKPNIIVAMMGCQDKNPYFVRYGNITRPVDYWLAKHIKTYALLRYLYYEHVGSKKHISNLPPKQPKPQQTPFKFTLSPLRSQLAPLQKKEHDKQAQLFYLVSNQLKTYSNALKKNDLETFFFSENFIQNADNPDNSVFVTTTMDFLSSTYLKDNIDRQKLLLHYFKKKMQTSNTQTANACAFFLIHMYLQTTQYSYIPDIATFLQKTYPNSLKLLKLKTLHSEIDTTPFSNQWLENINRHINDPVKDFPYNYENCDKAILRVLNLPVETIINKLENLLILYPQEAPFYTALVPLYMRTHQHDKIAALYNLWIEYATEYDSTRSFFVNFWTKALASGKQSACTMFPAYQSPMLTKNYKKLATFCQQNNIVLICMQYPMLEIKSLKQLLTDFNVEFVSNAQPFRALVLKNGFATYFVDSFGGCFGHATVKGNKLIAKNAAAAIKELLS